MREGLRVLAVAGEASGDALLWEVVRELRAGGAQVFGLGGPRSVAAGLAPVCSSQGLAAHGLLEAAGSVPATLRAFGALKRAARHAQVALLVDYPEVNERLAARLSVPVVRLAVPQAWAWRPWRAQALRKNAANLCLFAFEAEWLRRRGVHASWVGHPIAQRPALPPAAQPGLALLPGSRVSAIERLLPPMLAALDALPTDWPVHLARAPGIAPDWLDAQLGQWRARVQVTPCVTTALAASSVAVAGAGTVTLDAALAGRPVLTLGRLHPASARVARLLLRSPSLALPNLCWGERRLPELWQDDVRPERIAQALRALAAQAEGWREALHALRVSLSRPHFAQRVAAEVWRAAQRAPRDFTGG